MVYGVWISTYRKLVFSQADTDFMIFFNRIGSYSARSHVYIATLVQYTSLFALILLAEAVGCASFILW